MSRPTGVIDHFDEQLRRLELQLSRSAKIDNPQDYYLLRGIPGIGKILALVLLYEIHDIRRFPRQATSCRMRGW